MKYIMDVKTYNIDWDRVDVYAQDIEHMFNELTSYVDSQPTDYNQWEIPAGAAKVISRVAKVGSGVTEVADLLAQDRVKEAKDEALELCEYINSLAAQLMLLRRAMIESFEGEN